MESAGRQPVVDVAFSDRVTLTSSAVTRTKVLDRFRSNPHFAVELRGEELLLHMQALQINLRHPDLEKLAVRQAIYHAIDRDALIRAVWYGAGHASNSPIPYQAREMHADDLPSYPYDPARAQA